MTSEPGHQHVGKEISPNTSVVRPLNLDQSPNNDESESGAPKKSEDKKMEPVENN